MKLKAVTLVDMVVLDIEPASLKSKVGINVDKRVVAYGNAIGLFLGDKLPDGG